MEVLETGVGGRNEERALELKVRLLGAYHDGHLELTYLKVRRYHLSSRSPAHGDWLYDEIRLSSEGFVLHEIEIGDDTWEIECEDVVYEWRPKG